MQNEIGADVIMALDDVISSQTTGERVEEVGGGGGERVDGGGWRRWLHHARPATARMR